MVISQVGIAYLFHLFYQTCKALNLEISHRFPIVFTQCGCQCSDSLRLSEDFYLLKVECQSPLQLRVPIRASLYTFPVDSLFLESLCQISLDLLCNDMSSLVR